MGVRRLKGLNPFLFLKLLAFAEVLIVTIAITALLIVPFVNFSTVVIAEVLLIAIVKLLVALDSTIIGVIVCLYLDWLVLWLHLPFFLAIFTLVVFPGVAVVLVVVVSMAVIVI